MRNIVTPLLQRVSRKPRHTVPTLTGVLIAAFHFALSTHFAPDVA